MANGVIVSQDVYYDSSDIYTGEPGSITNMYVIEDFIDLMSVPYNPNVSGEHYCIVKDIEMNDYNEYKNGISTPISEGGYTYIHGLGHKIRNLILRDHNSYVFRFAGMYDIIFENLILINCTSDCVLFSPRTESSTISGTFKNIQIGAYLFDSYSGNILGLGSGECIVESCSFNIRGVTKDGISFGSRWKENASTFKYCHIHTQVTTKHGDCIDGDNNTILDSSYITGNIKQSNSNFSYTGNMCNSITNISLSNSYIAVNMSNDAPDFGGYITYNINAISTSFVDSEIIQNQESQDPIDNLHFLSTSQCKNPEYLLSIGFPVVPAEGMSVDDSESTPDYTQNDLLITDDTTGIVYKFGINNGVTYFSEHI